MAKLLAVKPLSRLLKEAENEGESGLKRTLGPLNLITLGIGAIIGAGIFVLTGQAAAKHAGPAVVLSFVVAGITCAFAGLCYAEFASLIPIAGSAYTYGYATLGEFVAWIIGWDLVLEYAFGAATVASGWSGYFVGLLADFGITYSAAADDDSGDRAVPVSRSLAGAGGVAGWCGRFGAAACDGCVQSGGVSRDHGGDGGADYRDSGVGEPEYGDRDCEAGGGRDFSGAGHRFPSASSGAGTCELDSVYSAERRAGTVWHKWNYGGRGVDLLCVYRVRRGIDGGAGGEESRSGICRSGFWVRWWFARCCTFWCRGR